MGTRVLVRLLMSRSTGVHSLTGRVPVFKQHKIRICLGLSRFLRNCRNHLTAASTFSVI